MENIVLERFEKYKDFLSTELKEKYHLTDESICTILQSLNNVFVGMVSIVKEKKTAHEKYFSDIILNSTDAIIGFNPAGKIFLWNKGAERIFGFSKIETQSKDLNMLMPDFLLEKRETNSVIEGINGSGFMENHETQRISKNGDLLDVSISRFPVYNQDEFIGSVEIIRDLTRLKSLERELKEKEQLALIGTVVSNIAHNLSNPLNIISGNADYLLIDKKSTDKDYEEIKIILDQAVKITKSIRHLLNFSRPLRLHKVSTDINVLIENALSNVRYIIENKRVKIEKILQKDLPKVKIDRASIEEVFNNILTNSVQAIKNEGSIRIKTNIHNNTLRIEVMDSGTGISKENMSKVFQPFFSSKEYGKGTGLGLALAKRIVNQHNGEIKIKSTHGKGTTVTVILPLIFG